MSKTEQDLDATAAEDALDELAAEADEAVLEQGRADEALDEALVDSIEQYTADDDDDLVASDGDDADVEAADVVDGDDADATETTLVDADRDEVEAVADPSSEWDAPTVADADDDVVASDDLDHVVVAPLFDDDEYTDDDFDDDGQTFDIPKIVMATEDDPDDEDDLDAAAPDGAEARDGDAPAVSDDILEELRRADIDGPIVEIAPQDDTTSARRRPKRPVDYDPAPVPIPLKVPRILGRKPRVRKVTRVVRHVDPWSVFKIAIIANLVLYLIVLTAGVLLWNVAYATGTVENVERFFESFGWQSFEFNGGEIYHASWIAGLFLVVGLTGLAVLGATLFNLITDLVGGVRFTVLEEEVVESRTSPMRRFVVRRPEPEIPVVTADPSGSFIREAVVDDTGDVPR